MRKIEIIAAALMMVVCLRVRAAEDAPAAATAPAGTAAGAALKTAAVVGGRAITVLEVTQWLRLADVEPAKATPQQWQEAVGAAINRAVMLNAARDGKIEVTDEEATRAVQFRRTGPDAAEYKRKVEMLGLGEAEERQRMREQLLVEKLLAAKLGTTLFVTPGMIADWYGKNKDLLASPETRIARVITLRDADKGAAKAKLETLRKGILAGADFAEAARKNSADPWAGNGGLLPEMKGKGSGSVFAEQVFGLAKKGDVSEVFETAAGVHIVRLDDVKPPVAPPLEQVQELIRNRILAELREKHIPEVVGELRRRMIVQIFWENLPDAKR